MSQTKIKTGLVIIIVIALATSLALHFWAGGKSTDDKLPPITPAIAATKPEPKLAGPTIKPPTSMASASGSSTPAGKPVPASTATNAAGSTDAASIVGAHEQVMRALIVAYVADIGKGSDEMPFNELNWFNTTGANLNPDQLVKLDKIRGFSGGSVLASVQNPERVVLLYESAFQLPDGQWSRVYGFADGHIETATSTKNDFTDWEAEHTDSRAKGI